ncbi:hypothetical protein [Neobacillus sp. YIM B06451]|nr:hypothetical protein [Neobacillus sp. YIM B06451]
MSLHSGSGKMVTEIGELFLEEFCAVKRILSPYGIRMLNEEGESRWEF